MDFQRRTLLDVSETDLTHLEQHFSAHWADVLREMAISHFLTLMSDPRTEPMGLPVLADLAIKLTFGISNDIGGTQPYIPLGHSIKNEQRKAKVLALLVQGFSYVEVGRKCGITARHVRSIEQEDIRKKRQERNESIPGWRSEAQALTDAATSAEQEPSLQ